MKSKISLAQIVSIILITVSIVIGIWLYPSYPDQVASHWGVDGEVNGWMSKFWGLFFMPVISTVLLIILSIVPGIDPKKKNIEEFRKYFDNFVIAIMAMLFYLYILTILWNLDYELNMNQWLMPAFAMVFYEAGVMIGNAKSNYTIGIRTPWTIANEDVWNKTHLLGGKLFKGLAVATLFGIIMPELAVWFVMVPVLLVTVILVTYSYIEFKKQHIQ